MSAANAAGCIERINVYLAGGGLFNPEMAMHDRVRDLLIDCRAALAASPTAQPDGEPDDFDYSTMLTNLGVDDIPDPPQLEGAERLLAEAEILLRLSVEACDVVATANDDAGAAQIRRFLAKLAARSLAGERTNAPLPDRGEPTQ